MEKVLTSAATVLVIYAFVAVLFWLWVRETKGLHIHYYPRELHSQIFQSFSCYVTYRRCRCGERKVIKTVWSSGHEDVGIK